MKLHTEKSRAPFIATQILQYPQKTQSRECIFIKAKKHTLRLVEYRFVWRYYISMAVHKIQENQKLHLVSFLLVWYNEKNVAGGTAMANRGKYIIGIRLLLLKQYLEANAGKDRIVSRREIEKFLEDKGYLQSQWVWHCPGAKAPAT